MLIINIVVVVLFAIVVYFDLKSHEIPAFFTTSILFILSIVNFANIPYGIIALIFAWMLYETDFMKGIADVKMIAAIGLMCSSIYAIISLVILVTVYGALYKIMMNVALKKKEIAFTLPLLLCYLIMWISGVI